MEIFLVHLLDFIVNGHDAACAFFNEIINLSIWKPKVIFIGFPTKTIRRCLINQICRNRKLMTNLLNLMHHQISKRTKIANTITVFSWVPDKILGKIASVGNAATSCEWLCDCIQNCHTETRWQIDLCLFAHIHYSLKAVHHGHISVIDINNLAVDIERFHNSITVSDIRLVAVWH